MKGGTALKYGYAAILIIMAGVMIVTHKTACRDSSSSLIKIIKSLLIAAVSTTVIYAAAITVNSEHAASLLYGMYFSSMDFLLVLTYLYVRRYSEIKKRYKPARIVLYSIAAADTVLMILNVFLKNVFVCHLSADGRTYEIYDISFIYIIHRLYIIVLVSMSLTLLLYKFFTSPKMYRKKYAVLFVILSVVVALDIVSVILRCSVDLAIAAFGILGFAAYYFSFIYIPHDLVERLLSAAVKSMNDGIVCFDSGGKCIFANDSVMSEVETEKLTVVMNALFKYQTENNTEKSQEYSWKILHGEKHIDISYKSLSDSKGVYLGCFFVFHDETEEILKYNQERYQLTHDKLTDLYNREYFYEKVRELLDESGDKEYLILCCDIKDFKLVNDVFGVEKGDELLRNIAEKLRVLDNIPDTAIYGRMSGDRFAVCISSDSFREFKWVEEVHKLGELSENKAYHVYIHLGVFPVSDKSLEVSVMCDRAFMAINSIKDSYSETISYYDEKLRDARIHEKKLTGEFNDAIRNGQFKMFLQPQINADGVMTGAEALVRWFHPEQGIIPPLDFIGVFEKSGLIGTLDHHIWECACELLKKWKDEGRQGYHISVNISPKDFYFMDIYEIFTGLIEKYDITPADLKLEITETAIITDAKNHLALVDRLRAFGFQVEIDDFGSGYSSLSMLKEINADIVKVDMGFLEKVNNENLEKSRAILSAIISLSKNLGMGVVTEGVETREQVDFLIGEGCDVFQGYYFDRPMSVEDFESKYFS